MYNSNGERKYNSNVCTFEKALIILLKPISFDTKKLLSIFANSYKSHKLLYIKKKVSNNLFMRSFYNRAPINLTENIY